MWGFRNSSVDTHATVGVEFSPVGLLMSFRQVTAKFGAGQIARIKVLLLAAVSQTAAA